MLKKIKPFPIIIKFLPVNHFLKEGSRRIAVILVCLVLLASCSASGPRFLRETPDTVKANIYVYKVGRFVGSANAWYLSANGRRITVVKNEGYFPFAADPGNVTFSAKLRAGFGTLLLAAFIPEAELITINVEPNKEYFVRFRLGPSMELVPKEQGLKEIEGIRRLSPYKK